MAKNLAAVKSWPLPERLTKVSVTGWPARRWSGVGAKLKFWTSIVTPAGCAATGAATSDKPMRAARRERVHNISFDESVPSLARKVHRQKK